MCDFWKGTFIEYATALSPYIIALAGFLVTNSFGILSSFREKNENLIRNTWLNIVTQAKRSVHLPDENDIVHSPYPKTWEEAENDAIELAKKEHPAEWEQYRKINEKGQ
jgi:hypothetical protein